MGIDKLSSAKYNAVIGTRKGGEKSVSPKMGRPKSENPKDVDVKVRFDKIQHEKLMKYCGEHGITRAEAIREGVNLLLGEKRIAQPLSFGE